MRGGASTCWTEIDAAARGSVSERESFAHRYLPVVKAYLLARWRRSRLRADVDDAVQEVFVECYRNGGVLDKAERGRPGGFRGFLFGVARNVARRVETRRSQVRERQQGDEFDFFAQANEGKLEAEFDRAWAVGVMRQAAELQRERADDDEGARQRVELLRLRFQEALPIREIATRWGVDAQRLHYEYLKARKEFEGALRHVVAYHNPDSAAATRTECEALLDLL